MDKKITEEYTIKETVITEENQEDVTGDIQEFIHIWHKKFDIDFNRDVKISIDIKHKEEGTNLIIKVKESEVQLFENRQLSLFSGVDEEEVKTKVRTIPATIVDMPEGRE